MERPAVELSPAGRHLRRQGSGHITLAAPDPAVLNWSRTDVQMDTEGTAASQSGPAPRPGSFPGSVDPATGSSHAVVWKSKRRAALALVVLVVLSVPALVLALILAG